VVSETGIGLEYFADLLLMAKIYHIHGMEKETMEFITTVGKTLDDPWEKALFLENPALT
jgi:hypothetical protein